MKQKYNFICKTVKLFGTIASNLTCRSVARPSADLTQLGRQHIVAEKIITISADSLETIVMRCHLT